MQHYVLLKFVLKLLGGSCTAPFFSSEHICKIIVKLDTAMDLCDIRTALKALLEPHNDSLSFGGVVSRVGKCLL